MQVRTSVAQAQLARSHDHQAGYFRKSVQLEFGLWLPAHWLSPAINPEQACWSQLGTGSEPTQNRLKLGSSYTFYE